MENRYQISFWLRAADFFITDGEFRCWGQDEKEALQAFVQFLEQQWQYDPKEHVLNYQVCRQHGLNFKLPPGHLASPSSLRLAVVYLPSLMGLA